MDHLGVEVETSDEFAVATARLAAEGMGTATEVDTACCYAIQDKAWVTGPGDEPPGLSRQGRRRCPRQDRRLRLPCTRRAGRRHRPARRSLLLIPGIPLHSSSERPFMSGPVAARGTGGATVVYLV